MWQSIIILYFVGSFKGNSSVSINKSFNSLHVIFVSGYFINKIDFDVCNLFIV